jgi:hypothetical protein
VQLAIINIGPNFTLGLKLQQVQLAIFNMPPGNLLLSPLITSILSGQKIPIHSQIQASLPQQCPDRNIPT